MCEVRVLDCTLRDGGYVNEWAFGDDCAQDVVRRIASSGVDYTELGFIRNCEYERDVIQFNDMSQVTRLFKPSGQKLAIMVEIGYGYPASAFPERTGDTADLIRIIVWKRMVKEAVEYCRQLKDLGYEVSLQATRTDQYSESEFGRLVETFNKAAPNYVYIVDTFGLLTKKDVLSYAEIADANMNPVIGLGFHAHNNMHQAFSSAAAFVEHDWHRPVMLDASLMGIGRGAGNLCLEVLFKYLAENGYKTCNSDELYGIIEDRILPIYKKSHWGYSVPYLLSAEYGCNPTYVQYLQKKGLGIREIAQVFAKMKECGSGIRFDTKACDDIVAEMN